MMTKIIQYALEIISSLVKFFTSKKEKENDINKVRDDISSDTASSWLRTFGGQDKRSSSSSKGSSGD